jgi:hypothetical protein
MCETYWHNYVLEMLETRQSIQPLFFDTENCASKHHSMYQGPTPKSAIIPETYTISFHRNNSTYTWDSDLFGIFLDNSSNFLVEFEDDYGTVERFTIDESDSFKVHQSDRQSYIDIIRSSCYMNQEKPFESLPNDICDHIPYESMTKREKNSKSEMNSKNEWFGSWLSIILLLCIFIIFGLIIVHYTTSNTSEQPSRNASGDFWFVH